MPSDRNRLKVTFDSIAARYHQARPDYPGALFDELLGQAGLRPGDRLLEVGCGTGKATIPLARLGFDITCLELGADLAGQAGHNLAGFPQVRIVRSAFERWEPSPPAGFDLIYAATAWHWLDPATKYRKAWRLLRPGGHLAFWSATHLYPADVDQVFLDIQQVYDEVGDAAPPGVPFPTPDQMPEDRAEIERTGLFTDIRLTSFCWEMRYTAEQYIALLGTFSNHIEMEQAKRDRVYDAFRQMLAQRPDGQLTRHWGAVLHVAKRGER